MDSAKKPRNVVLVLPFGPIRQGVTASHRPGDSVLRPDLTDAEADSLWQPRPRAARPADSDMHAAIFGDTSASTPDDARRLGWS